MNIGTALLALLLPLASAAQPAGKLSAEERARLESARTALRSQAAAKPEEAELWVRIGRVEQALGEAAAARDAFKEAVRLAPGDAGAWSLLALAHEKLKETAAAVAAWEATLARSKDPALSAVARKHLDFLRAP